MNILEITAGILDSFVGVYVSLATVFLGNYLTVAYDRNKRERLLEQKRKGVKDSLSIKFRRLLDLLVRLSNDAEGKKYFQFLNINSTKSAVARLQKSSENILLIEDEVLRKDILEVIDEMNELTDGLNDLEIYYHNENQKFKEKESRLLEQLRALKVDLLKLGIYLDRKTNPKYIDDKLQKDRKLKVAKLTYKDLNDDYLNAKDQLSGVEKFCSDKRTFFAIKIVAVQAKLRTVSEKLSN